MVALLLTAGIVYVDRDGYLDAQGDRLTFLDCLYYAAVTLSTTGYGDITPISEFARAINIFVITPLRIAFLILLVGTTLEVLTETSRQAYKIQRWRSRVRNHTVVIGYGTKGKTAVAAMVSDELVPGEIVVVDTDSGVLERAAAAGLVTVHGDATKSDVLRLAGTQHASSIIVATSRDDTAVLVTLTAREIAPKPRSWRPSGRPKTSTCCGSRVRTRWWSPPRPPAAARHRYHDAQRRGDDRGSADPEAGLAVAEREVEQAEVGGSPRHLRDIVLGVVRDGQLLRIGAPEVDAIEASDRLLYIRQVGASAIASAAEPGAAGRHQVGASDERKRRGFSAEKRSVAFARRRRPGRPAEDRHGGGRRGMARRGIAAGGFPQSRAGRQRRVLLGAAIELADKPPPEAVFLGRVEGGRHVWAVRAALQPIADPDIPAEAVDLRGSAESWTTPAANWCRRHRRC
ncbi:transmembrane cation transporter [Mycobacterium tuberculosis variant bovis BCG]|nr:transmembrane cation transporter [Mycobacterium tuberculosis variant bovis BCG]